MEVEMAINQSASGNFNYNNVEKKGKNFMYANLKRGNCYNCDFTKSNFDYASFRGTHFKSCILTQCSFKWTEFIGTNLKGSELNSAVFENAIFDSANLEGTDFKDAKFKNTIFMATDVSKAKNLNTRIPEIRVFNEMPQIEISEGLKSAALSAMNNKFVKDARVLDTKDGDLNLLSLMILLENFDEETLIKGLNIIENQLDKSFYTLSYLIKYVKNSKTNGAL
jgi:hypothetical protein